MLRTVRPEELDGLIAAFWPVALDLTRSAYPTYADGVKTPADFASAVTRAWAEDWGEVLVHVRDGADNALVVLDAVDDAYVSLHICLTRAHQPECLAEVLAYLRQRHAGKTLWLGFAPENWDMLAFVRRNGFRLLDNSVNWNIPLERWQRREPERLVMPVCKDNYDAFSALWTDEGMYWNAGRIAESMARWLLFVTADGLGAAACMRDARLPEIFGFQYRDGYDEAVHRALLTACLNAAAEADAGHLTYFAAPEETAVMTALGFRRVSAYQCYEMML